MWRNIRYNMRDHACIMNMYAFTCAAHQIIRATIPLFTAISFAILEGRKFSPLAIMLLIVTVTGAVIVVAFHSQKWKLDTLGLVLAIASNFMVCMFQRMGGKTHDIFPLYRFHVSSAGLVNSVSVFIFFRMASASLNALFPHRLLPR